MEAEKAEQKMPCFDARALRQMGLHRAEVNLLQVFFMKARTAGFNISRYTRSECLRALVGALRYLPRTDHTGRITVESYKASDTVVDGEPQQAAGGWVEAFRHKFARGLIWSNKERREPALLAVLAKVFEWVEKFQKAHGLYQELPARLKDGMAAEFDGYSEVPRALYQAAILPDHSRNDGTAGIIGHEALMRAFTLKAMKGGANNNG